MMAQDSNKIKQELVSEFMDLLSDLRKDKEDIQELIKENYMLKKCIENLQKINDLYRDMIVIKDYKWQKVKDKKPPFNTNVLIKFNEKSVPTTAYFSSDARGIRYLVWSIEKKGYYPLTPDIEWCPIPGENTAENIQTIF